MALPDNSQRTPLQQGHHWQNSIAAAVFAQFVFLLYMREQNDQWFHTYCTVFRTLDNAFDEDWDGHRDTRNMPFKVLGLRFSGVVFFVKFTSSCWMPRAFFINWFANVVASWLLATSTTSRRVTLDCAVSRCLWPFPISVTRRGSDVNPAIDLSLINSSEQFSYSHWAAWLRILVSQDAMVSSSFCSKERNFAFPPRPRC